jgi:hypothetical protein
MPAGAIDRALRLNGGDIAVPPSSQGGQEWREISLQTQRRDGPIRRPAPPFLFSYAAQLRTNNLLAEKFVYKSVWMDATCGGKLLDQMIYGILERYDETAILDAHLIATTCNWRALAWQMVQASVDCLRRA